MTDNQEKIQAIFQKRISIVAEISILNAQQLQNSQKLLGNGIDLQRCAERLAEEGESKPLRDELENSKAQEEHLQSVIADCNRKLKKLEERVLELDQRLESL